MLLPVRPQPCLQLSEGLWPERVEALGAVGMDLYEACLMQDVEVAGDARLVDADFFNNIVYRVFAAPEHLDDAPAGRVGQNVEHCSMHDNTYV